jgi:hypothetical protein
MNNAKPEKCDIVWVRRKLENNDNPLFLNEEYAFPKTDATEEEKETSFSPDAAIYNLKILIDDKLGVEMPHLGVIISNALCALFYKAYPEKAAAYQAHFAAAARAKMSLINKNA